MSPREAPINALHLWAATALVLCGMASMVWVGGRWQGEVNIQLQTMTEQVKGLRLEISTVAAQVNKASTDNAVQDTKIEQIDGRTRIYAPSGRQFDR